MDISLYFHIPFCRRRCGYCDFNTYAGLNSIIPDYVNSLCDEVSSVFSTASIPLNLHTIYFGGGTPSLISIEQYQKIFQAISSHATIKKNVEISIEANPETVNEDYITGLRQVGFNRISFGMQSASPEELRILDRDHRFESVVNGIKWSKLAGFSHINLDLIFGIPGQSRESWQRTLNLALNFGIDHFSIYSLIVEDGTRLKRWIDRGILPAPDDDLGAFLYEDTMDFFDLAHYQQYEISNWSRGEGSNCRHNMQYWRFLPYLGFGAGAHGFFGHTRTENRPAISDYIQSVRKGSVSSFPIGPAALEVTRLTDWELIQENLMVSMRLTSEGIDLPGFQERYHLSLAELFPKQLDRLQQAEFVEYFNDRKSLRLTRKGRLFGNRVFSEFIGNDVPQGFENLNH